jgi:hypothetical protein
MHFTFLTQEVPFAMTSPREIKFSSIEEGVKKVRLHGGKMTIIWIKDDEDKVHYGSINKETDIVSDRAINRDQHFIHESESYLKAIDILSKKSALA